MIYGWDHPATVARYERFCQKHDRYRVANRELIAHAAIEPGMRVLDLAAGTGRTAELAVSVRAVVVCVEPTSAMRRVGQQRVPQARWCAEPPPAHEGVFDRVLCGAAAWQWSPFAEFACLAHRLLANGGALVFNMPSLYLGVPEQPGGGPDSLLAETTARLAGDRLPTAADPVELLSFERVEERLEAAGFAVERWGFQLRISAECLLDWLRIPVLTDALLPDLDVDARDRRIDETVAALAPGSWKWEAWTGWTAWKR